VHPGPCGRYRWASGCPLLRRSWARLPLAADRAVGCRCARPRPSSSSGTPRFPVRCRRGRASCGEAGVHFRRPAGSCEGASTAAATAAIVVALGLQAVGDPDPPGARPSLRRQTMTRPPRQPRGPDAPAPPRGSPRETVAGPPVVVVLDRRPRRGMGNGRGVGGVGRDGRGARPRGAVEVQPGEAMKGWAAAMGCRDRGRGQAPTCPIAAVQTASADRDPGAWGGARNLFRRAAFGDQAKTHGWR